MATEPLEPVRRIIPNIHEPIGYVKGDLIFATDQFRQWMEAVERQLGGEGQDIIAEQDTQIVAAAASGETATAAAATAQDAADVASAAADTAQSQATAAMAAAGTAEAAASGAQNTANAANALAANIEARINAYTGTGPIP